MRNFSSAYAVFVFWLAGLCAAAQFAKVAHIFPELQLLYPEGGAMLGFLVSLISLVGALFGFVVGVWVGHIGPRKILLIGLILGSFLSLAQCFALPLYFFLLTRIFEGISHLAIVVSAPMLIAQYSSDRLRSVAMALWGSFFGVSFALTAWIGLPLVAERGISALFLAHAFITGVTALLVSYILLKKDTQPQSTTVISLSFRVTDIINKHISAWTSPSVAAPAVGWLFYTITFVSLLAILPGLMPPEHRAVIASLLPLSSIVSSMTLGVFLLRRYNAVQVVNIGFTIAICFAMLLPLLPGEPIVCLFLFAALGLVQGASFASIPQLNETPTNQALANGVLAQAGNIGNLIGTPLLVTIQNSFGTGVMSCVVTGCYIAAGCAHLIFAKQRKIEELKY